MLYKDMEYVALEDEAGLPDPKPKRRDVASILGNRPVRDKGHLLVSGDSYGKILMKLQQSSVGHARLPRLAESLEQLATLVEPEIPDGA